MIRVGDLIPYFSLANQNNRMRRNDDYTGKWLIIYVYPRDDTPGCTLEARGFSAKKGEFERLNAHVIGLSDDDVNSHEMFCSKHNISVELLADPQAKLIKELGIESVEYQGKKYWSRTTFIANPKGEIRYIYTSVNADGHETEVLQRLKILIEEN